MQAPSVFPSLKRVFVLGTPLLFGQLTQYLHQITDSAMLGHFGQGSLELGAMGIAGQFTWVLLTFLWPLSMGVQALASRRYGRQQAGNAQDSRTTGRVLDNGLVVVGSAALLALAVSFLGRPVLDPLLSSDAILDLSMQYIAIIRFSLPLTGFFVVLQGFLGAINQTRYVMYAGILSNALNIALNWVLIFGNLGFPALGIQGAALGTTISAGVAALYLFVVLFLRGWKQEYGLFRFRGLSRTVQKDIVRVALAPGIQNILAILIFLVYQTIVESYSAVYLAATHGIFAFMRLNKTLIGGFARSASIIAGNALGRQDIEAAKSAINASGLAGLSIAGGITVLVIFSRHGIAQVFTNDPATQAALAEGLLFFAGFYFIEAIGYSFEMVFTANGYGRYVLASEFSTNILFILGATILVLHFFPGQIHLAWLAFGLYQLCHALLMILGWLGKRWFLVRVETAETPEAPE